MFKNRDLGHGKSSSIRKRGHNTFHSNHDIHKKSYLSDTTDNIIVHQNENYTNHRSSNSVNKSLLKRRIIYGILAICITLSKTSLAATDTEIEENTSDTTNSTDCTKPAVEEFPSDFLTAEQRENGGIILYFIIATYLIFALGNICDDYFVPVLEIICETLKLSDDVAGATFMAAGTSAPEFFTNIMGTFVTKSDLGIGTIVGSAVFNIFGVISVCGLFAGRKIHLDWYPITRDCIVYGITVILLIIVLIDEKVYWYESIIFITFYILYIGVMFCNTRIEEWAFSTQRKVKKRITNQTIPNESTPLHSVAEKAVQSDVSGLTGGLPTVAITSASMEFISDGKQNDERLTITGNDYRHMLQPQTSATPSNISEQTMATDTTVGSDVNLLSNKPSLSIDQNGIEMPTTDIPDIDDAGVEEITMNSADSFRKQNLNDLNMHHVKENRDISNQITNNHIRSDDVEATLNEESDEDEAPKFPWQRPDGGFFAHLWWIMFLPVELLFFLTIPDVRRAPSKDSSSLPEQEQSVKCCSSNIFRKLAPLSFVLCVSWIGVISYLVTWMITIIGFTIGVPDTVMGLSFLAVGTSIPEVFSSLIVCRQGKGSMAVSNSIGSNTFDILVCLGIPWMIKALLRAASYGEQSEWFVQVNSEGLAYTVISLLASLCVLYCIMLASRFILSRTVAFVCLIIYAVFLTISLLFELNVFFVVNKPMCPSDY